LQPEQPMSPELPGGFEKNVVGYCDPLSVRPGDTINFKLSSYTPGAADLSVVKLISGDDRPHGTGLITNPVDWPLPDRVELTTQALKTGSYARVIDMPAISQGEFEIFVYPTLLRASSQTVADLGGLVLGLNESGFSVEWQSQTLAVAAELQERRWYRVRLGIADGLELDIERLPAGVAEQVRAWHGHSDSASGLAAGDWYFAVDANGDHHFNGRLEAPEIKANGQVLAAWDFSLDIASQRIVDEHDAHSGQLYQTPTRGVCGVHWDGTAQSYHQAPTQYGAIHFHEDDLTDAGWADTVVCTVPQTLTSGQYALRVVQEESEDYIPFFVRPAVGARTADLAYLVPTASYLAYANQRLGFSGGIVGSAKIRHANDAFLMAHEDVGYSLYEYHRDGSGVHFSSRLRPILNMKPQTGTWAFNADTHITAWLDAIDEPFDVVTDEDLHLEGSAALQGYRTVITGTHPEYYSSSMRTHLSTWLGSGGRLMYMGGNGFYWRIAYDPENSAIIEVRRAEDGTRAWIAQSGEYYQQFDGEYGGMWRRLGKPPNELVGVGFAAQGFDGGTHYRVQPGAVDPRVEFIVDGLQGSDIWGKFGNQGGGAVGEEIDRWDASLGSPAHAVIIATSEDHKPGMLRVKEEFHMMEPLGQDAKVKADMVFFEVPGGGAVFSTGSISYAGSLAHNEYDNEIAKITGNVLARFLDETPFEFPNG
jgi:N,N-dimethylformamidase